MIVEIGHFPLILALGVALVQSVLPLIGAFRRHFAWMAVGCSRPGDSVADAPRRLDVHRCRPTDKTGLLASLRSGPP